MTASSLSLRIHLGPVGSRIRLAAAFICFGCVAPFTAAQKKPASTSHQAPAAVALDVLRVRAGGDPSEAVVHIPAGLVQPHTCDAVIIGAGMGGVSAALEAARQGITVCLTEPTLWIGGQMTSQGVSAFDGNRWIDTTGATATFAALSRGIRASYSSQLKGHPALHPADTLASFNPGNCWVSSLCFQPQRGLAAFQRLLQPYIASGRLRLWVHTVPIRVSRHGRTINSVLAYDFGHHQWLRLQGKYFVDASALGDLVALSGLPYRTGAESRGETGEPDAPAQADPDAVQSINYPFLLLRRTAPVSTGPGITGFEPPPPGYDKYKLQYSLTIYGHDGSALTYKMFAMAPGTPGPFWNYRRLVDAAQFAPGAFPGDLSMINWNSNDYCDAHLLSGSSQQQAEGLQQAKRVSLGFAWWLRHRVPRDDGDGRGYPELELLTEGMGSADGLAQQPYIRESRRIIPLREIVEQSLAVKFQTGARAELYPDSVGIGQYPIDIHSCGGNDFTSQTKPYEVPLGALIARDADNLLAASLDIGTTHITNGAYRLHPTLWAIGEAVGAVIAQSIQQHMSPAAIDVSREQVLALQRTLVAEGHPVFWFDDVTPSSPFFAAAQLAAAQGWLSVDHNSLHFAASSPMSGAEVVRALRKAGLAAHSPEGTVERIASLAAPVWSALSQLQLPVTEQGRITRGNFALWLWRVTGH